MIATALEPAEPSTPPEPVRPPPSPQSVAEQDETPQSDPSSPSTKHSDDGLPTRGIKVPPRGVRHVPPKPGDQPVWVRFTSGEWLKASLESLEKEILELDSDKLDIVEVDWDDVDLMWVPVVHVWVRADRTTVTGPAVLYDGVLSVRTAEGIVDIPQEDVVSIAQGNGKEIAYWGFDANVGVDLRFGNTDQSAASFGARVNRTGPILHFSAGYSGSIGFADRERNVHWHLADTQFKVLINRILFVAPFFADGFYDEFQNIRFRGRPGAGLGTYWEINAKVTWETLVGGIFQYTEYIQDLEDGSDHFIGGGIRLSTSFSFDATDDLDILVSWQSDIIVNDMDQTAHKGIFKLDYDLTDAVSLYTQFSYSRIEDPPTTEDGVKPESDDIQILAGLNVSI